jgi:F-type H+-transporting ATPase subunit delta
MKGNRQTRREAKQLFRLCLAGGTLDEDRARRVARGIADAGHRECRAVLKHFLRLVKLDRNRHTAAIESATPLPEDLQAGLEAGLKRKYGADLVTRYAVRPSLIGGMRIQVGSDVYDSSVLAGLAALEKSF